MLGLEGSDRQSMEDYRQPHRTCDVLNRGGGLYSVTHRPKSNHVLQLFVSLATGHLYSKQAVQFGHPVSCLIRTAFLTQDHQILQTWLYRVSLPYSWHTAPSDSALLSVHLAAA